MDYIKMLRTRKFPYQTERGLTFALEDGVPGVPPGIIGVEGVPGKRANGKKRFSIIFMLHDIIRESRFFFPNNLTTSHSLCISPQTIALRSSHIIVSRYCCNK